MERYPEVYEIILNYYGWRDTIECGIKEIGELFNIDCKAVSYATKRFERKLNSMREYLLSMLKKITQSLKGTREVSNVET